MWLLLAATVVAAADVQASIETTSRAVLLATIDATCTGCDWGVTGSEAVMVRVTVDDRYTQHVPLTRAGRFTYRVVLGTVEAGAHRVRVAVDAERTARRLRGERAATLRLTRLEPVYVKDPRYLALAHAPFIYERPNTIGRFSDVPALMYYEVEPTSRGTRYRYTVIFTNEDGGTPVDRLMATWGRSTDIEYVYSVELDAAGQVLAHDFQGPDHEVLPYSAALDQRHARLWVVTDNNMVLDRGTTEVRYLPAPSAVTLENAAREVVMDADAWLYAIAASELRREGKIAADAPPGNGLIPDPRRYVYLEGCGTLNGLALTFAVRVGDTWLSSDRGVPEYRIARDGCFRGAVPLPAAATPSDVRAVRVEAFERPGKPASGAALFTHLNRMFMLDDGHVPGRTLLQWQGRAEIRPGSAALEIPVK